MEFFDPQVSLYKHIFIDADSKYKLHIVTFTDNTNYVAGKATTDTSRIDEHIYGIGINIDQSSTADSIYTVHQVSHIIDLGALANGDDLTFEITLTVNDDSGEEERKKPKPKTVKPVPIEIDRPGDVHSVGELWKLRFDSNLG